jgi:hypothetical protein
MNDDIFEVHPELIVIAELDQVIFRVFSRPTPAAFDMLHLQVILIRHPTQDVENLITESSYQSSIEPIHMNKII